MYDPIVRSAERSTRSCRPATWPGLPWPPVPPPCPAWRRLPAVCVAQWDQARIYRAGDTLQKGGVLYRANQDIWNAPPDHPAGAPYTNLGACDGSGQPAAGGQPDLAGQRRHLQRRHGQRDRYRQ